MHTYRMYISRNKTKEQYITFSNIFLYFFFFFGEDIYILLLFAMLCKKKKKINTTTIYTITQYKRR